MTVTDAAQGLGIGRQALSKFLNARSSLSPRMAQGFERAFGANAASLLDMQARFDDHAALAHRNAAELRPFVAPIVTIKANQLSRWANELNARQELAVLLRRLVHSTTSDVTRADFPGYDLAERRGWDGQVEAAARTPWVPKGASGWEFGCNRRPRTKANHDYEARLRSTPEEDRRQQAFVFVTPHLWPGKTEWANEKRRLNEWRDVRAYDASDLEQWLETSPATQVWFAERLGCPVGGFKSLDRFWHEWAAGADPPLSPALFAEAVENHSDAFLGWLQEDPTRPFTVAADSRDEAIAFVACLLKAEGPRAERPLDQAVVFYGTDAVQRLGAFIDPVSLESAEDNPPNRLLAVARSPDVERSLSAWRQTWHCVAIEHPNAVGLIDQQRDVELGVLTPAEFGKALAAMNISGARVDQLALDTARSPTILRRRLSTTPEDQRAHWTRSSQNLDAAVVPALVGAWNAGCEADREAVARVAGTEYEQVEKAVARLQNRYDAPLWSIGQYRGVCSRIDALFSVAPAVTKKNLDDFFFLAEYVLSERDPALDLPPDSRWMAAVYDKLRNHSEALRSGIRETLVLLAQHGGRLFDPHLDGNSEQRVAMFVRRLLDPLTLENLLSHKADFPDYAEAAPDVVLDLLEENLATDDPAVFNLLASPAGDDIFQDCPRSGLLWALESLAWFPGRLPRVASVLARLSERRITDRWVNTPFNTLVSLFRSWMPQTVAPLAERLRAVECIANASPEVGWRLCVDLLPRHHDVSVPNHLPKWRGDTSSARRGVLQSEVFEAIQAVRKMTLNWTTQNEETLGDLVGHIRSFSADDQSRIWGLIDDWATDAADDAKVLLQDRIRKDCWVLDDGRARRAVKRLTPGDAVARNRWLFTKAWPPPELAEQELSFEKTVEHLKTLRVAALREIMQERDREGLAELVENCEAPREVGYTLNAILDVEALVELAVEFNENARGTVRSSYRECLTGLLATAEPRVVESLVQHRRLSGDEAPRLTLFLAMPFRGATWRLVDGQDQPFRESYWSRVEPSGHAVNTDELNELIDRLIEARRPNVAFWAVQYHLAAVETRRLERLLRAVARHGGGPQPSSHSLGEAVQHLAARVDVTASGIAEIEFAFLSHLRHTEHGFPNLQKRLLDAPELFAQAVALAYRPKHGGEDRSPWNMADLERRTAAAWAAQEFLMSISIIPGTVGDGEVDVEKLHAWLATARGLCAEIDRATVGDITIGEWLARASAHGDVARPRSEVADAIERMASDDVDSGFCTGARNARGASIRSMPGGDQERAIAKAYRQLSSDMTEWPRTRRLLQRNARAYEDEAERWDRSDAVANRLPSLGPVFDA